MSSYTIVYADNLGENDVDQIKDLEAKVNNLLAQGWSCMGGVVSSFYEENIIRIKQW